MYTLRIFSKNNEGLESNYFLGDSYEFIKSSNKQLFKTHHDKVVGNALNSNGYYSSDELSEKLRVSIENCNGFITGGNGVGHYLNKKDTCYIMSSDGKTFAKIY